MIVDCSLVSNCDHCQRGYILTGEVRVVVGVVRRGLVVVFLVVDLVVVFLVVLLVDVRREVVLIGGASVGVLPRAVVLVLVFPPFVLGLRPPLVVVLGQAGFLKQPSRSQ